MKKVLLAVLFLGLTLIPSLAAQASPASDFAPAYLAAGGGYSDVSHGFGWAAYAKQVGIANGTTNLPVYSYTEVRAYRFPFGKNSTAQSTDFTTGFLFPFYDRKFGGVRVLLAVDGNIGISATSTANVGYTAGAKVVANLSTAKTGRWSLVVSADPNRSSVSGIHASQATVGFAYGFKGL